MAINVVTTCDECREEMTGDPKYWSKVYEFPDGTFVLRRFDAEAPGDAKAEWHLCGSKCAGKLIEMQLVVSRG